jgi:hypothetical protein
VNQGETQNYPKGNAKFTAEIRPNFGLKRSKNTSWILNVVVRGHELVILEHFRSKIRKTRLFLGLNKTQDSGGPKSRIY